MKPESECFDSDPAAVHQQSPPPVPNQHSTEVSPNPYKQKINFGDFFKETYIVTFKNLGWLFLTSLLYLVTAWIPYINIGTTIAMFNLPIVLSRKESVNPLFIFDAKYRKYMGEYITLWGHIILAFFVSMPFLFVPLIVLKRSWCFATILLLDKEVNPSEAMMLSSKYTFGHKFQMWFFKIIANLSYIIAGCILCRIFTYIHDYLVAILLLVLIPGFLVFNISQKAIFYRKLVLKL